MKQVNKLMEILNKFKEQDDAVGALGSEPTITDAPPVPGPDAGGELPPVTDPNVLNYDNEFFSQLKVGDIFNDKDIPEIAYKVVADPVIDPETQAVTSLPCEVESAPEGNEKNVSTGDQFDAVTAMPKLPEPPPEGGEGPAVDGGEPPIETPPVEEPSMEIPPGESLNKGQRLLKKFQKLGEAEISRGLVQEIRADGMVAVRQGHGALLVLPMAAGVKAGDEVEIEDRKKIIGKVASKQ
jgi:hypothetical protein